MKILTYLQARNQLEKTGNEEFVQRVLTITGRAEEFFKPVAKALKAHPEYGDIEIVESSLMGREILKNIPREEWFYLVNQSLTIDGSLVANEGFVKDGKIFSAAFVSWLMAQENGQIYKLSDKDFTREEAKIVLALWSKQDTIVERDEIAALMWGESWSEKYSDWGIDAVLSRIRKKINGRWQIVTVKGRGYMLAMTIKPTKAPQVALNRNNRVHEIPASIYPTDEYITYMNDPKRVRKVYQDLMRAVSRENLELKKFVNPTIICVNSYSYDNVDAMVELIKMNGWSQAKVYFVHYDPRAIEMHQERIKELELSHLMESIYDDMRESKIKSNRAEMVINDFRLNFNQDDKQNKQTMANIYRILKPGGFVLASTVVDGRYENVRYGVDQEKAPVNASRPGLFQADEHLVRRCWSVPYYRQLFEKTGFEQINEFDVEEGRRWGMKATISTNPWQGPYYRRWYLEK